MATLVPRRTSVSRPSGACHPPCLRLCPAYPGNPRSRIEGESPPDGKGHTACDAQHSSQRSGVVEFGSQCRVQPPGGKMHGATSSRSCSAAAWPVAARVQQPAMPVIGVLYGVSAAGSRMGVVSQSSGDR